MLFIVGLQKMTRQEKIALLAQIMAINAANVINEGLQKTAQKAKNILLKGVGEILKKTGAKEQATKIETFDMNTNWNPEIIKSAFDKAIKNYRILRNPN